MHKQLVAMQHEMEKDTTKNSLGKGWISEGKTKKLLDLDKNYTSTHGGHPLCCVAAEANLDELIRLKFRVCVLFMA